MHIEDLPEELLLTFLEYLQYPELKQLELVSKYFNSLISDNQVYKKKYLKLPEYEHKPYFDEWLEENEHFHVRKMVNNFYKKRIYQYQFLNGREIRGSIQTKIYK